MAHISQDFGALDTPPGAELPPTRPPPRVAAAESSGWIPVGERLPPLPEPPNRFSARVLVRVQNPRVGVKVDIDEYFDERWGWSVHAHRVTHWQPLPPVELGS